MTYARRQQHRQQGDALLGDINELPRVTVTRVVRDDGRVIETVQLAARHHGVYETTNHNDHHLHHQQQQNPSFTGEYDVLRR